MKPCEISNRENNIQETYIYRNKKKMSTFLKEGAFGCIYKPGIECNGKPTTNKYVSKIQKTHERTIKEPEIGQKIRKNIPYHDRYFAPALEVCPVKLSYIHKKELNKCHVLDNDAKKQKHGKKEEKYVSMKIKYVGEQTLGDNMKQHYLRSRHNMIEHVMDTHIYLANAIKELVDQKIVHYDLKENNVVYSKTQHVPIIIDFGTAFEINQLYNSDVLSTIFFTTPDYETYTPWCLEVLCIGAIIESDTQWEQKKVNVVRMEEIVHRFFMNSPLVKYEKAYIRTNLQTDPMKPETDLEQNPTKKREAEMKRAEGQWIQYIRMFKGKKGSEVIQLLCKYWNTWDMYSVNVMYWTFIHKYQLEYRNPTYTEYLRKQVFTIPTKRDAPIKWLSRM